MLTDAERRLIQKYYLLPKLGRKGFAIIIVLSAEWLFLNMLDDLVFHNPQPPYLAGWIAYFALVIAVTVFCCYAYLSAAYGMRKPAWKTIERKRAAAREQAKAASDEDGALREALTAAAGVAAAGRVLADGVLDAADIASASYSAAGAARYAEATAGISRDAARVAHDLGVELPNPKRVSALILLGVLAILALTYGVHYLGRMGAMGEDQQRAAATLSSIERTFEAEGFYVVGASSAEEHDADGYSIYGNLFEMGDDGTRVGLRVDNEGVVYEVSYTLDIDPELSLEENLAKAEDDLARLQVAVAKLDVPFEQPGLAAQIALPEAFKEAFLAGTLYEDIFFNPDDLGSVDGAYMWCTYDARSRENLRDGMWPSIWLSLETDW